MVKKLFLAAVMLSLIVSSAAPALCDEPTAKPDEPAAKLDEPAAKFNGPATKLGRGICNILTFPLEIPEQMSRMNNSDGPFAASTVGVLKGLGSAIGRACVGLFEAATFMSPGPKNYEPVLKDPEYFLETSNF